MGLAGGDEQSATQRSLWRARPVGSRLVRATMVLVPALAGAIVVSIMTIVLPEPHGVGETIGWWNLVVLASLVPIVLLTRLMQRFAPLAFLLSLTLVFPDEAPSRFKVARAAVRLRRRDDARFRQSLASGAGEPGQVLALIAALGSHDKRTRGHSERVRVFTEMLAEELRIAPTERNKLRWAALLHDIGKLTVPPEILNKPERPSDEEWKILYKHPTEGRRIATPLLSLLGPWAGAIEHHHERFDGKGYPSRLAGDDIPYGARILAVSDAYEVMTAARPYKTPMGARAARGELVKSSGSQFDPAIVRSFLNISIGRLWRGIGIAAMLAQLPLLGTLFQRGIAQRIGRDVANLSAAGALVLSMAAVGMIGSPPEPSVAPRPITTGVDTPSEPGETDVTQEKVDRLKPKQSSNDDEISRGAAPSVVAGTRTRTDDAVPRERSEDKPTPRREPTPEPSPEDDPPPEDYFASGTIAGATPTSSVVGGGTQQEFLLSCAVPHTQGVDGWVFPLPEQDPSHDATAGISGDSTSPLGYNLDVFLYSADCTSLGAFQGGGADESGPLPPETRYVVVNQPTGLDTQVSLAITY